MLSNHPTLNTQGIVAVLCCPENNGGDAQPQIHVQLLSAMLDFGMNVQQAIAAPCWCSGRLAIGEAPGQQGELSDQAGVGEYREWTVTEDVFLENRSPRDVPLSLDLLGHRTFTHGPWEDGMGHAQAHVINPETYIFEGATDSHCDGLALGW